MEEHNVWDDVPTVIREDEKTKLDRMQLNRDFFATFNSESGMRVLEYFKKHTLDTPSWIPGVVDGQCQWREGQNSIVREIVQRVQKANDNGE